MDSRAIRVLIRIRPRLAFEGQEPCYNNLVVNPQGKHNVIQVLIPSKNADYLRKERREFDKNMITHEFSFDHVLGEAVKQDDVCRRCGVDAIVESLLGGYNATIFAYGQTGSGKTFTMDGLQYVLEERKVGKRTKRTHTVKIDQAQDVGIVFRCIDKIFEKIRLVEHEQEEGQDPNTDRVYSIKCSFLQIYNEHVHDLLAPLESRKKNKVGLKIRWAKREGFFVENLYKNECDNPGMCKKYFITGVSNRAVASHAMNTRSSRSHSIFTVYLTSAPKTNPEMEVVSKLHLVDLAGSERIRDTGATGKLLKQSIGINRSLFVLRKVIKALSVINRKQAQFARMSAQMPQKERSEARQGLSAMKRLVPYRDSSLTRLLKDALGGNSITVMIACLGPRDSACEENCQTLRYASLAKSISNRVVVNADPRTQLIQKLQAEVKSLREQLLRSQRMMQLGRGLPSSSSSSNHLVLGNQEQEARGGGDSSSLPFDIINTGAGGGGGGSGGGSREVGRNLIESVEYIKELVQDNSSLREKLNDTSQLTIENESLNKENAELRHQVKFYQNLVVSNKSPDASNTSIAAEESLDASEEESDDDAVDVGSLLNSAFTFRGLFNRGDQKSRNDSRAAARTAPRNSRTQPRSSESSLSYRGHNRKHVSSLRSPKRAARGNQKHATTRQSLRSTPTSFRSKPRRSLGSLPRDPRLSAKRSTLRSQRTGANGASSGRKPWAARQRKSPKVKRSTKTSSKMPLDDLKQEATIPMVELAKLFEERSMMSQ